MTFRTSNPTCRRPARWSPAVCAADPTSGNFPATGTPAENTARSRSHHASERTRANAVGEPGRLGGRVSVRQRRPRQLVGYRHGRLERAADHVRSRAGRGARRAVLVAARRLDRFYRVARRFRPVSRSFVPTAATAERLARSVAGMPRGRRMASGFTTPPLTNRALRLEKFRSMAANRSSCRIAHRLASSS